MCVCWLQCDVQELFDAILNALHEGEKERARAHLAPMPACVVVESRTVLHECFCGLLLRSRLRCAECGFVSDKLEPSDVWCLELPEDGSSCDLEVVMRV